MRGTSSIRDCEFGIFIWSGALNECQLAFRRALLTTAGPAAENGIVGGLSNAIAAVGTTVLGTDAKEATAGVATFDMNPGGGSTPSAISRARCMRAVSSQSSIG